MESKIIIKRKPVNFVDVPWNTEANVELDDLIPWSISASNTSILY